VSSPLSSTVRVTGGNVGSGLGFAGTGGVGGAGGFAGIGGGLSGGQVRTMNKSAVAKACIFSVFSSTAREGPQTLSIHCGKIVCYH